MLIRFENSTIGSPITINTEFVRYIRPADTLQKIPSCIIDMGGSNVYVEGTLDEVTNALDVVYEGNKDLEDEPQDTTQLDYSITVNYPESTLISYGIVQEGTGSVSP